MGQAIGGSKNGIRADGRTGKAKNDIRILGECKFPQIPAGTAGRAGTAGEAGTAGGWNSWGLEQLGELE